MVKVLSFREWWGIVSLGFLVGLFLLSQETVAFLENDKQALLDFVNQLPHLHPLNWDANSSVCKNWTGVGCNEDGSRVIALRLPGVGFNGPIPNNTLSRLTALQILSLRSNGINGTFPMDFDNLKNLSYLYLHYNNFLGPLPFDCSVWQNLTSLNLSNYRFNGTVPSSISGLSHLTALNLANNSLSGTILDFHFPNLQLLNLSNNNLIGTVPKSLQKFPKNVFISNDMSLLDYPVSNSSIVSLPQQPNPKLENDGKLSERQVVVTTKTNSYDQFS